MTSLEIPVETLVVTPGVTLVATAAILGTLSSMINSEAAKPVGIDENNAGDSQANVDIAQSNISPPDESKEEYNNEDNEASSLQNNAIDNVYHL